MERDEADAVAGVIKEKIAELHRDARARVRRWLLDGYDVRGKTTRKEGDAAVTVAPDLRELVNGLAPEARAMLRPWVSATYDVRGARRARGSTR